MIISKKEFDRAVQTEAEELAKLREMEMVMERMAEKVIRLERKVARFEQEAKRPRCEIKGYYIGGAEKCTDTQKKNS